MLGYVPFPPITEKPYPLSLAPYSFFWLELQPGAPSQPAGRGEQPVVPSQLAGRGERPGPEAPRPSALPQQNEATEIIMRPLKPSNTLAEDPPST